MADIITQSDLRSTLEAYTVLGQTILDFRRRLAAGSFVEPGELNAHDPQEQPIDMGPTEVLGMYGLDIAPPGWRSEVYQAAPAAQEEPEPEAREPEFPEWLTLTPLDTEYGLTMDERAVLCNGAPVVPELVNHPLDLRRRQFIDRGRADPLDQILAQFPITLDGLRSALPRGVLFDPNPDIILKGQLIADLRLSLAPSFIGDAFLDR